jgi:ABC-2 type transport system ATP-binding protein
VATEDSGADKGLKIHINRDEDVRAVVEVINNSVQLRTFREVIPSMNDIFIKAVANHSAK